MHRHLADDAATSAGPLEGARVLDLGLSWAGPFAGMLLADLGADVIKVESRQHIDILRWSGAFVDGLRDYERSGYYLACNRGKRSVTIDLKSPRGRDLLLRLVDRSDVLIENFAPRVMRSLGITAEVLLDRQPRLVVLSMSGYGATGPDAGRLAYGDHLLHATGFASITGHPDDPPTKIGTYYGDPVAGLYGALGVLAALDRVGAGGPGEHLDYSQAEGLVSLVPAAFMAASTGQPVRRSGDRALDAAPHGFFRCAGRDVWVALSVRSDLEWERFGPLVGLGSDEGAYPRLEDRLAASETIDEAVRTWTATMSAWDVADACQGIGVACHPVHSALGLLLDDHLAARRFFSWVHRPLTGPGILPGVTFKMSGDAVRVRGHAPVIGEHNEDVLVGLLGLDPADLAALVRDGVVG